MRKPIMFIGSSSKNLPTARALCSILGDDIDCRVWKDCGLFPSGSFVLPELLGFAPKCDFAAFIFAPDDNADVDGNSIKIVRDNVLLEYGLFVNAIGLDRCFCVVAESEKLHLPTDTSGITRLQFEAKECNMTKQNEVEARVNQVCTKIRIQVQKLSRRHVFTNENEDLCSLKTQFDTNLLRCLGDGIYDEYIARNFIIQPKSFFEIRAVWDFKTISVFGKPPIFSFNHNSKFEEFTKEFHIISYLVNQVDRTKEAQQSLQVTHNPRNKRYYVAFSGELSLTSDNAAQVYCEYTYKTPLPEFNVYSSYMYPAKQRSFNVMLENDKEWMLKANCFCAFKNMGNNTNSLYSNAGGIIENKTTQSYNVSISEWSLPGTGIAFTVSKKEHTACKWAKLGDE